MKLIQQLLAEFPEIHEVVDLIMEH